MELSTSKCQYRALHFFEFFSKIDKYNFSEIINCCEFLLVSSPELRKNILGTGITKYSSLRTLEVTHLVIIKIICLQLTVACNISLPGILINYSDSYIYFKVNFYFTWLTL